MNWISGSVDPFYALKTLPSLRGANVNGRHRIPIHSCNLESFFLSHLFPTLISLKCWGKCNNSRLGMQLIVKLYTYTRKEVYAICWVVTRKVKYGHSQIVIICTRLTIFDDKNSETGFGKVRQAGKQIPVV